MTRKRSTTKRAAVKGDAPEPFGREVVTPSIGPNVHGLSRAARLEHAPNDEARAHLITEFEREDAARAADSTQSPE